jgi:hypothetical protein
MYDPLEYREDAEPARVVTFTSYPQAGSTNQNIHTGAIVLPGYTRLKEYLLSDGSKPHSRWKDCEHYKCSSVPGSGVASVNGTVDPGEIALLHNFSISGEPDALYAGEYGTCGEFNYGLTPYFVIRPEGGFVPAPGSLDELLGYAMQRILPQIKAELSLLNTLFELKDVLSLRTTIESVARLLRRLFSLRNIPLRQLFRTKADVYLQFKFNIQPLLSDIAGIYRALASHERRINDLITRSGRVRISHFSKMLTESDEPNIGETNVGGFHCSINGAGDYPIYTNSICERFVTTDPALFHVEMQYNYNYTAYQVEHARLLSLLDSLGVNFNPQIIWNAIPWSFVLDWVLGVGRYLDQFARLNMAPKINILQCIWSTRRSRRIIVQGYTSSGQYYGGLPNVQVRSHFVRPVVVETAYRRSTFTPSLNSITSSGLSPTEISLGAALIISRRRRPKRLRR